MRIGVYVCHCGSNIAGTVDVAEVARRALTLKDVVHAEDIMYTCAEPGQAAIQKAIQEKMAAFEQLLWDVKFFVLIHG